MVDILDEVLNEEKDIKRLQTFRKILPIIIITTVLIAIFIGGYNWFLASKTEHNKELGDLFIRSFSKEYQNKNLIAQILEELKEKKESKLFEMAAIRLASRQIQAGDTQEAMKSLDEIVSSKDYSDIVKSYARILYFTIILDAKTLTPDQENKTREYFQYFSKDSQALYATATLLKALFYFKINQLDFAKDYAAEILKLPRASVIIKDQARALISNINNKTK